jgi:hypothetical protein
MKRMLSLLAIIMFYCTVQTHAQQVAKIKPAAAQHKAGNKIPLQRMQRKTMAKPTEVEITPAGERKKAIAAAATAKKEKVQAAEMEKKNQE